MAAGTGVSGLRSAVADERVRASSESCVVHSGAAVESTDLRPPDRRYMRLLL